MTTPKEFYQFLAQAQPCIMPAPQVPLKIGPADIMAARLLLWLEDQMPDEATVGDFDDVLDAAKWWSTFFSSAGAAREKLRVTVKDEDDESNSE